MRKVMAAVLLGALLASCNNEPDPTFQKTLDARAAADAGDPYIDLDHGDRRWGLRNYTTRKAAEQQAYAQTLTINMQSRYAALLGKLDDDKAVDRAAPLFKTCRADYQRASDYAVASDLTKDKAAASAKDVYAALEQCRTQLTKDGSNIKGADTLRRFASYGMNLAGVALTAKGNPGAGAPLWSQGSKAAEEDMPGFKVTLKNLR